MNSNNTNKRPTLLLRLGVFAAFFVIQFVSRNSDNENATPLILILVAAIFIAAFGILLWHGIKEWKKTDEEILASFSPMVNTMSLRNPRPEGGLRFLIGGVVLAIYALYRAWGNPAFSAAFIFIVIVLSIIGIPVLYARYHEKNALHSTPQERPRVTGEQLAALLVGFFSCGFILFFIGIGVYHGVWWFVVPPGLIFLVSFSLDNSP